MVTLRSRSVKTVRPPNLSVKMPSGMLTAAAKKGSIAARTSTWVELKAYHLMRKGASAENIPQTAKPSENATSDMHKTLALPGGSAIASTVTTGFSTAPPTKRYFLFAGHFNCLLTALASGIKLRFLPLRRDGRATPASHWRCGHTPRHRAPRAHRSTHWPRCPLRNVAPTGFPPRLYRRKQLPPPVH